LGEQQDFLFSPLLGRLEKSFLSISINYPWLAVQECYENKPSEVGTCTKPLLKRRFRASACSEM